MIYQELKKKYGYNTPIFTREILEMFPQYTKAYVFRILNKEIEKGKIEKLDRGIYYIPQKTSLGIKSTITAEDAVRKRYIESDKNIYGIYSGLTLQNAFQITMQVPNTISIVTNRETTAKRYITIDGMEFVISKSRTAITSDNVNAYYVLEAFTDLEEPNLNKEARDSINEFIKRKKISKKQLLDLSKYFPGRTIKNMCINGII